MFQKALPGYQRKCHLFKRQGLQNFKTTEEEHPMAEERRPWAPRIVVQSRTVSVSEILSAWNHDKRVKIQKQKEQM